MKLGILGTGNVAQTLARLRGQEDGHWPAQGLRVGR